MFRSFENNILSPLIKITLILALLIILVVLYTCNKTNPTTQPQPKPVVQHPAINENLRTNKDVVDLRFYFRKTFETKWELASDGAYRFRPDQNWIWITLELTSEPKSHIRCIAEIAGKQIAEETYTTDPDGFCRVDMFANGKTRQFSFDRPKTKAPLKRFNPDTSPAQTI